MDASDIAVINDWFSTHSCNSFKTPKDSATKQAEEALSAAVDVQRVNHRVIAFVVAKLGNSANEWEYILQFNDHIGVFHAGMDLKEARVLINNLEREGKEQLGLMGSYILEPINKEEYDKEREKLAKRYPENEQLRESSYGRLCDVFGQLHRTCGCWLPLYVIHALHRSGNYLKPGATRRKSVDLDLWRWCSPIIFREPGRT